MSPIMRTVAWSGALFFLVGCGRSLPVQPNDNNDPTTEDAGSFVCSPPSVDTSGGVIPPWAVGFFSFHPPGPNPAYNLRISGNGDFVWETGSYVEPEDLCDSFGGEHGIAREVDGGVGLFPALDGGSEFYWSDNQGDVSSVETVTLTQSNGGIVVTSELGTQAYVSGTDCGCEQVVACTCDPFSYYAGN